MLGQELLPMTVGHTRGESVEQVNPPGEVE